MPKDIWAWYNAKSLLLSLFRFFFLMYNCHLHILLVCYGIDPSSFSCPSHFRLEEITNSSYQQLDDERKRRAIAVQTLNIAEQSNAELKKKLADEEHTRKSADSALEGA